MNYFSEVEDPRVVGRCKHKLSDILMIALITYLCGGEDYSDMEEFCLERGKEFYPLIELPNGCPSEDTFARVLQAIKPSALSDCLAVYGQTMLQDLKEKHIAIDGKKTRGSSPKQRGNAEYILSAWLDEYSLSLGQAYVQDMSNEITAIPDLLDSIELEGAVVTLDAMGTQTHIAEHITKKKADYVLCIKKNQKHLYEEVQDAFSSNQIRQTLRQTEKDHGRFEERTYSLLPAQDFFLEETAKRWQTAQSIIKVERKASFSDGTSREQTSYYLSSLSCLDTDIETFAKYIRGHWGVENGLHWQLDVNFKEDACRARKDHSAKNLNIIRKFAIALVKQMKDKLSIKRRLFKAAMSLDYLKRIIQF